MKKLVIASVLGASLFGANAGISEAAECPFSSNNNQQQQTQAAPAPQQQQQAAPAPAPQQEQTKAPAQEAPKAETSAELTADEQQMLNLVNQEREKKGLPALKADPELTKVARVKAKDMIDNNYFDHNSPTYGSPFDMMKKFGVEYKTAGENLAGNSSVDGAHTSLMNSQGHRENILKSDFTNVGIGVVDGGQYGKMFVQLFKG
ncbi:CAP domain-containing protein [Fictibacillus phosphorivorans]|uniref:CAP domain-containing protein n=1 Tax=Fictibacillus phosphorivorans TaxID=1221500 RepID=UPI00203B1BBA|nr:CAP domain-containing protein [Fictibacillus phosphorivorans]MCM3717429.1 CAP domain-containing protein [Fictibacillus phosphorivorans]MCM3775124.1 CAP domain-containing protein [Fictibacillus phosphorivorans]